MKRYKTSLELARIELTRVQRLRDSGAVSEVPDNIVVSVDFNHAVVELICDENIAVIVETTFLISLS